MPDAAPLKYRAFLSYAHADTRWAKWLHGRLESFTIDKDVAGHPTAIGIVPATLRPVFRDRDDFTGGHSLAEATIAALDQSAALLVLCSAVSATRPVVNEEVRLFRARHPGRPVIPVIIDGSAPDNFPPALRFDLGPDGAITDRPAVILGTDLREAGDGQELGLAKVVAGLTGLAPDDIFRRTERARRSVQRRWITGISGVAAALAALAVWAEINRREAVVQRTIAEHNFAIAKEGANALVFDIAQSLRNQEGMRSETVRKILGSAEGVIGKLAETSNGNPDLLRIQAGMLNEFADTYAAQGDSAMQAEVAAKSLAILDRLLVSDPANKGWQEDRAITLSKVGDALFFQGRHAEALGPYKESVAVLTRLLDADQRNGDLQHGLAAAYDRVANALVRLGRSADAVQYYTQSRTVLENVAPADPGNAIWQRDLCAAYNKLGTAQFESASYAEARAEFGKCVAILEALTKADPTNARWQHDLAITYDSIGRTLLSEGKRTEAVEQFGKARTALEGLVAADPSQADRQHDLAVVTGRLADAAREAGDLDGALAAYRANLARLSPLR